jgi:hypothetical protein
LGLSLKRLHWIETSRETGTQKKYREEAARAVNGKPGECVEELKRMISRRESGQQG